jgi:hypothetical protein
MSDLANSKPEEACAKRPIDEKADRVEGSEEVPAKKVATDDGAEPIPAKRGRGPSDCLDWDDSDEGEFTPFTQERPELFWSPPTESTPVKKVKKSASKRAVKSSKKSSGGTRKSSAAKGKSLGETFSI